MNNKRVGIAHVGVAADEIIISGNDQMKRAVRTLSNFGLITFSRMVRFKSSEYAIHFFKPTEHMKSMYSLGNELLIVGCFDGMNDFRSRTKDFIDYMLVTNTEFKNRLDKVTCFLIDGDVNVTQIVKDDRATSPDSRLIVPFSMSELQNGFTEDLFNNRLRDFLYEKDLFGIAVPLQNDTLFFGKDRSNVIAELYARYKQGEEGGLFGLRRIGKTSILNLLKLRIAESDGVAVYFDCSNSHHYRWYEFLQYIVSTIRQEYSIEKNDQIFFPTEHKLDLSDDRYDEKHAAQSFSQDIQDMYKALGNRRILLILDEIESISFKTSPSVWWKNENDALYFWQAIRANIQMYNECLSFIVAGVNPMCIERQEINGTDNPIFGMFNPTYTSLFEYEDIKNMVSSIGGRQGLSFEEPVYGKLMEDYGGHPFLVRQVCSKINNDLNNQKMQRPTEVSVNSYKLKSDEYRQDMTSVIEQILGVIQEYYSQEFELLKRLALDGRNAFKKEIALGDNGIRHLMGYCLIEKEDGEYFIRIKSIEDYLKTKFIYDTSLNEQRDKRARINIRRDDIEEKLRTVILFSLNAKYGKKAKNQLITIIEKTSTDQAQRTKLINAPSLKKAIEELYLPQLKIVMEKHWKDYAVIFPDKSKYEAYMDLLQRSRIVGAHAKSVTEEEEVSYSVAFDYFEKALEEY